VTAMNITIHASMLPHTDPNDSLAFDRDTLGFEVRGDVESNRTASAIAPSAILRAT